MQRPEMYILQVLQRDTAHTSRLINAACSSVYQTFDAALSEAKKRTEKAEVKQIMVNREDWDTFPIGSKFFFIKQLTWA